MNPSDRRASGELRPTPNNSPLPVGGDAATIGANEPDRTTNPPHGAAAPWSPTDRQTVARQSSDGAFTPGTTIANRYRVVSLLGAGGMGQVYRADDLTLGVGVALKFLPAAVSADGQMLARIRDEVRTSRSVTHPNVCRVHDIGEELGRIYITMEYIDGEDLASLLRRIGRLPHGKALQVARQLCMGLSAAHESGIIHRDLKPANIMIDGRGNARITDFGIASRIGESTTGVAGTPAYMAPEQARGEQATRQSDIYALGLVLYELFTGKLAQDAHSVSEVRTLHQSLTTGRTLVTPSSLVAEVDPATELAILRCLDPDPACRPQSAIAVIAALPGGDPLAAAVAAGEIPSPQMIALSGGGGSLSPRMAAGLFASLIAVVVSLFLISSPASLLMMTPSQLSPPVLVAKAREHAAAMGVAAVPPRAAFGFDADQAYPTWAAANVGSAALLDKSDEVRPTVSDAGSIPAPPETTTNQVSAGVQSRSGVKASTAAHADMWRALELGSPRMLTFWYRAQNSALDPVAWWRPAVARNDPPDNEPFAILVLVDSRGLLIRYHRNPAENGWPESTPANFTTVADWEPAFKAAGLVMAGFTPVPPDRLPYVSCDTTYAWTGYYPDAPSMPLRVQASTYRGVATEFRIIPPWREASDGIPPPPAPMARIMRYFGPFMMICGLVAAGLLARLNIHRGRADRRGAFRLALAVFVGEAIRMAVARHTIVEMASADILGRVLARAAWETLIIWLFYLAVEPFVRRFWPQSLVSWARVLGGQLRDARVSRDWLAGTLCGCAAALLVTAVPQIFTLATDQPQRPVSGDYSMLLGGGFLLSKTWSLLNSSVAVVLVFTLLMVGLRRGLRRPWLVYPTGIFCIALLISFDLPGDWPEVTARFLVATLLTGVLIYLGLLATCVASFFMVLGLTVPLSTDFSAWHATPGLLLFAATVILAGLAAAGASGRWSRGSLVVAKPIS